MRNVDTIPNILPVRITIIRSINPEIDQGQYTFGTHSFEFRDGPLPLVDLLRLYDQVYVSRGHVWYRLEITGKLHGIGGTLKLPWNFIEVMQHAWRD